MHLHGSVESETRKVDWNRETPINEIREQLSHLVDFRLSRHTQQLIHHQVNGHLHNDLSIRLSYILNPIKLNYLLLRLIGLAFLQTSWRRITWLLAKLPKVCSIIIWISFKKWNLSFSNRIILDAMLCSFLCCSPCTVITPFFPTKSLKDFG